MMDNSTIVSEWNENFRMSHPTPSLLFGCILFLVVEKTNCLLPIFRHECSRSHRRV